MEIAVCGQATRPPVPVVAAHNYLIDAIVPQLYSHGASLFFLEAPMS
jgi:hypothetical protein